MSINAKPAIAYDNDVVGATLTASTEATGYPKENVRDWRRYTCWKGTGTAEAWLKIDAGSGKTFAVTCLGISGHDLKTQAVTGLVLQYSDDDITYYNCFTPFTPGDDKTIFKYFAVSTHRYFRLKIPTGYTAAPKIGVLFIGDYFQFPRFADAGFDPDGYTKYNESNESETGEILGVVGTFDERFIYAGFSKLVPSFITDTLMPFWESHIPKPFFWAWDLTNHPSEVYFLAMDEKDFEAPWAGAYRNYDMNMIGLKE